MLTEDNIAIQQNKNETDTNNKEKHKENQITREEVNNEAKRIKTRKASKHYDISSVNIKYLDDPNKKELLAILSDKEQKGHKRTLNWES